MQKREFLKKTAVAAGVGFIVLSGCTTTSMTGADDPEKRRQINAAVDSTLQRLYSSVKGSKALVDKSRGVLVFPAVLSAGFFVGGEYGEGALRVNGKTEGYYSTATGSLGLQIGAQSKAIIFLFMSSESLDKLRNSSGWTAGADATVAVIKAGVNGAVDLNTVSNDVNVIVMTNEGLMAGVTIEGTKVTKLKTEES
ncbi:MAG TPA: hypothetical protein DEB15_04720 [Pusillimonas sp.]|jgi:lipid-binding SYLF domain-containing protein|nr:hypothetical protein [Pusillimonas sp.]|tara:strand:- start:16198 stop:16785 length:588 start_codon:yes stop_codon:yes gene_type:complete